MATLIPSGASIMDQLTPSGRSDLADTALAIANITTYENCAH